MDLLNLFFFKIPCHVLERILEYFFRSLNRILLPWLVGIKPAILSHISGSQIHHSNRWAIQSSLPARMHGGCINRWSVSGNRRGNAVWPGKVRTRSACPDESPNSEAFQLGCHPRSWPVDSAGGTAAASSSKPRPRGGGFARTSSLQAASARRALRRRLRRCCRGRKRCSPSAERWAPFWTRPFIPGPLASHAGDPSSPPRGWWSHGARAGISAGRDADALLLAGSRARSSLFSSSRRRSKPSGRVAGVARSFIGDEWSPDLITHLVEPLRGLSYEHFPWKGSLR